MIGPGLVPLDAARREDHAYLCASDHCACECTLPGKRAAVGAIAQVLRTGIERSIVEQATWVPIPPSRASDDADYDDRLECALRSAFGDYDLDLRPASSPCDHHSPLRQSFAALYQLLRIDAGALGTRPLRAWIALFVAWRVLPRRWRGLLR